MMEYLTHPTTWLSAGYYLLMVSLVVLLFTLMARFRKYRSAGAVSLVLGVAVILGSLVIGDWSIPECYNADGKFLADDVKCVYPD